MPRKGAGPVLSQTAIIGAPLATNAISVPAPSPISMLPAASACAILLPPPKSMIFKSSPCFLKRPSSSPTLTGMSASEVGEALPTVSAVSAEAGATAAATPNTTLAMRAARRQQRSDRFIKLPLAARFSGALVTSHPSRFRCRRRHPRAHHCFAFAVSRRIEDAAETNGRKHGQSEAQSRDNQQSAHLADHRRTRAARCDRFRDQRAAAAGDLLAPIERRRFRRLRNVDVGADDDPRAQR